MSNGAKFKRLLHKAEQSRKSGIQSSTVRVHGCWRATSSCRHRIMHVATGDLEGASCRVRQLPFGSNDGINVEHEEQ